MTKEISINEKLYNDIIVYCDYNNINTEKYIEQALKTKLMLDKYGTSPFDKQTNDDTLIQHTQQPLPQEKLTPTIQPQEKSKRIRKPKEETKETIPQNNETKKIISKRILK